MGVCRLFKATGDGGQPILILRSQWLVDVFSSVITQRHLLEQHCAGSCDASELERFTREAVVTRSMLEGMWEHMGLEDVGLMIEVMQHFDLMFEVRVPGAAATRAPPPSAPRCTRR